MTNIAARFLLYLSSYFPLAAIFFFLFFEKHKVIACVILGAGVLGIIGLGIYLSIVARLTSFQVNVQSVQRKDSEAMSYIVTYVVPFLAVAFTTDWQQAAALSIFFFVLAIIYVNSNMIHINPMLNLVGYHLYEITTDDGGIYALVTKQRVGRDQKLSVVKIGDEILMEKKK
jgi:hypothetical protein